MKNRREFSEAEDMVAGIVEAIGSERLIEHIIMEMDERERREFVAELVDAQRGQLIKLNSLDLQEEYEEEIVNNLARLQMDDKEHFEAMRIRLIWKLAGGSNGV